MRIIDLSMPIGPHFRWPTETPVKGDIAGGDQFRVTRLHATCHGFSHVDAQAHILAGAPTIEATPLEAVVGAARIFDLRDAAAKEEIGAARLTAADPGGREGEILVLSTGWDRKRSYETRDFWLDAPWLNREAALWLAARKPRAIAFDFPQDYPIRLLLDGGVVPFEQHVTHDVCLRQGITLIEYLVNTAAIVERRVFFSAAPLKIPGADGAPARIYAIEGLAGF
ncbi:MAG: cyclase family protein [Methylobacteriaceae bacterium]|nr:cyclase family protein [Methylobacteriaceae bacterium]